jgi:hypothetical protein
MKKIFLFLSLILGYNVYAQNFDSLMKITRQLDCNDIAYNSALFFEKYISNNQLDSAKSILKYWEDKCGHREPLHRAKLLLALTVNKYHDSLLTKDILTDIFNYQNRMDLMKQHEHYLYDNYKSYFGYIPVGREYDKFTIKEFGNLKSLYGTNTIEYLLCEFYSDNCDTLFSKLQSTDYEASTLAQEYNKTLQKYVDMPESHIAFVTGVWMPTGRLDLLGVHPEFGGQTGIKYKKMNFDLTFIVKFINSPNNYYAKRTEANEPELTNHFSGGYAGIDVGRDIYTSRRHELQLTGGIAIDIFTALSADSDLDLKSASAVSYNFNTGLGYRYYFPSGRYLGLKAKYNVVDYTLSNVVDLTGNVITVHLSFGRIANSIKRNNLKALKYKNL